MALVFWLSACEKQGLNDFSLQDAESLEKNGSANLYSGITVAKGRVRFASSASFSNYFSQSEGYNSKQTEDFFAGLNFNSLKSKIQAEELLSASPQPNDPVASPEEEGSEGFSTLVEDENVYFFLNQHGEFQIESTVIRITPEFTYIYDQSETITFNQALEQATQQAYLNTQNPEDFFDVNSKLQAFKIETSTKNFSLGCGQSADDYHIYMSGRKMKAKIWSQNLGVFSSAGCHTKNLRKRLGIWWQERTDFVRVRWDDFVFEIKDPFSGTKVTFTYPAGSYEGHNVSKRIKRFQQQTAIIGPVCDASGKCKPKIKTSGCIKVKSAASSHLARRGTDEGFRNLSL